jgi:hypothetical protein
VEEFCDVRRTGITDIALVVLGFDPFSAGLLACAGRWSAPAG